MIINKHYGDGFDFINIAPKAQTFLGRWLSFSQSVPLVMPEGIFYSLDAYWHYLITEDERYIQANGYINIQQLNNLNNKPKLKKITKEFQDKIKKALDIKIKSSEYWIDEFVTSCLSFRLGEEMFYDKPMEYIWITEHLVYRRKILKYRAYSLQHAKTDV